MPVPRVSKQPNPPPKAPTGKHEYATIGAATGKSNSKVAGRKAKPPIDPSVERSRHHIYMETSRAEQQLGINVSYDNSFTAIKRDIKETVDKQKTKSKQ